jgi:hypothetical protein
MHYFSLGNFLIDLFSLMHNAKSLDQAWQKIPQFSEHNLTPLFRFSELRSSWETTPLSENGPTTPELMSEWFLIEWGQYSFIDLENEIDMTHPFRYKRVISIQVRYFEITDRYQDRQ